VTVFAAWFSSGNRYDFPFQLDPMPISDEDLIAYLLADVNPQQRKRIEAGLAEDEDLRARLSELRMVLGQLDSMKSHYEPPADLFASTMARIDEACNTADAHKTDEQKQEPLACEPVKEAVRLASCLGTSEHRVRRSTWDSTALIACVAVLFCLLIPTVLRARFESRRAQCAYRISYLGRGLIDLASMDPQHRFPAVAEEGPESFAGMFAVRLCGVGLVNAPSDLWCTSLEGCRPSRRSLEHIPSISQLRSFDSPKLELCRNEVGGDYAYSLGLVDDGMIVPPRCEGRTHLAVLADAPLLQNGREEFVAHDGLGTNIFFEDGHVAFVVPEYWQDEIGDNPFCNIRQVRAAGLNSRDASLGPSHFHPRGNE